MPLAREEKERRMWSRLAMVWALYYFLAFTLGNIPQYMQKTIWFGASLVGLATIRVFWRRVRLRQVPREGWLLVFFALWTLTGFLSVSDMPIFMRFLKLILELASIVTLVSIVLEYSGDARWFYLAFVGVAVVRILTADEPISVERIADTQAVARIASANAVGFYSVLGMIGVLGLFKETKRLWHWALLAAGGGLGLYGVVLSVSRGAFAALIATAILWPMLCLVGGSRFKMKAVLGALLALILAYWVFQFVIQDTYMGTRFVRSTHMEDRSTQIRFDLVFVGLRIFAENPVFGCGLGQFGVVSGTGYYAHNEVAEILSTTGLPGFFLYFSVYVMAWHRLTRSLQGPCSALFAYRINMARMILLILLITGSLSRPNFISQDTMFLLALVVGISHWAERMRRMPVRWAPPPASPWAPGFGQPAGAAGLGLPAAGWPGAVPPAPNPSART